MAKTPTFVPDSIAEHGTKSSNEIICFVMWRGISGHFIKWTIAFRMQQRSRGAAAMKIQQIHEHVYCDDQQVARATLVICGLLISLFLKMV